MKIIGYFLTVLYWSVVYAKQNGDIRVVSFEELRRFVNTKIYSLQGVNEISEVAVDISGSRTQIILGAKNYLIRLDLDSLNQLEVEPWKPSELELQMCEAKGQTRQNCQNYVRVLVVHNNKLFACGTNAFSPECTWRQANKLSAITERVQGIGKCPYHPQQNSSSLMLKNGDYFSATYTDFAGKDPSIYRIMGPSKPLRTVQQNSRWLNDPNFVSSYEIGEYIYFFFREMAVESKCEPGVYSRVARICKNDNGGNFLLEDNWTTFVKARLNCSLPGALPFAFNEIQSTYYDFREDKIHIVFTTPAPSIYGSAVCSYSMAALEKAFRGPFTYQENSQMAWTRVPNNLPQNQCGSSAKRAAFSKNETPAQRVLMDAQKYQIMYQAVQPNQMEPYIVTENERYTHIAVDQVRTADGVRLEIIFLATLEGSIKKMVQLPGKKKACLVEEIFLTQEDKPRPVKSLDLLRGKDVMIVSTGDRLMKIPVHRCGRHNTKLQYNDPPPNQFLGDSGLRKCINAQDPYCGWNLASRKCMRSPETRSQNWQQDLSTCPVLKTPVDGDWSAWSSWSNCRHVGGANTEQCKCRHRSCDNPEPQFGGKHCTGASVEVSDCTVNGGWTPWSEWSGCSSTCGSAQRYRKRSCTNPSPAFSGRVCVGGTTDMEACTQERCPLPASQRARWAQWGAWSQCTHKCDGGMRVRTRRCERPPVKGPRNADNDCVGNDQEWVGCNTNNCGEVRESSTWSDWMKTNQSREGHIETRFQSVCVASVEGMHQMKSRLKTKIRFCPANSNHCSGDSELEKAKGGTAGLCSWATWSGWSDCDRPCGGGTRLRERMCEHSGGKGLCSESECTEGQPRQIRECNTHSCQGVWSCWSDWSSCSVSCGSGRRFRQRDCKAEIEGLLYTHTCAGPARDDEPCVMTTCGDGWSEWTVWSVCSTDGLQRRGRDCYLHGRGKGRDSRTFQDCEGVREEKRMCTYNTIDVMVSDPQESASRTSNGILFKPYHLIIIGIIGFALGGVMCVGILLYCQRQHQDSRERELKEKYATLQRLKAETDVKSNHYVCPADLDIHIPPAALNNRYYSTGSLLRKDSYNKMTVKEATLKRNSLLRTGSLLRTSTNFDHMDHEEF